MDLLPLAMIAVSTGPRTRVDNLNLARALLGKKHDLRHPKSPCRTTQVFCRTHLTAVGNPQKALAPPAPTRAASRYPPNHWQRRESLIVLLAGLAKARRGEEEVIPVTGAEEEGEKHAESTLFF